MIKPAIFLRGPRGTIHGKAPGAKFHILAGDRDEPEKYIRLGCLRDTPDDGGEPVFIGYVYEYVTTESVDQCMDCGAVIEGFHACQGRPT